MPKSHGRGIWQRLPGEYRRNAGNNSGGFQRNSGGIRLASTWNSGQVRTGIPAGFHRNSGSVFTRAEPEDFRLWHETMLTEFPERFQRLLADPMWSGLDPQDQKDPVKVAHVFQL